MTERHAIQAPIIEADTVELARSIHLFRKQVLKTGRINYKGTTLDFTPEYLDGLAAAFREHAYDSVPLVFTDAQNSHTQAVEQIRGEVLGFERTDDGLDAIVRASNPKAAQLLRENPRIGVSVRIEQPLERADGKHWPAAVQHVLATANPRVTGMRPWQPVDLTADPVTVLDLSTYDFADGEDTATQKKESEMAEQPSQLTEDEVTRMRAILAEHDNNTPTEPGAGEYAEPTDEELAAIAEQMLADVDEQQQVEEPVAAGLANDDAAQALELANARFDAQAVELARLREERDAERYEKLRDRLAHDHGIPPAITELAKPLLLGSHTVELSNGAQVDAGQIVHTVMTELAKARLVDLSVPVYDTDAAAKAEADAKARGEFASNYAREYGL